jgi:phthalate 4,5-dioxygenase
MLTKVENELLTRVGPETLGGALLRRYWHPVLESSALEADGAPRQVRLLGEDFVAFRAADGRVGFVDEGCPHRRASLALARNENCALRCLFHGWKIDLDGSVLETPSEPPERGNFAAKVRTRRYHAHESAGLVWAYIGAGDPPAFPAFPFTALPLDHLDHARVQGACNWVQLLEGQVDSSHLSHLHSSSVTHTLGDLARHDRAPQFEVENTPWGFHVAAVRRRQDGQYYTRLTEFVMPYWEFIPPVAGPGTPEYDAAPRLVVCQVPVDDTHTIVWYVMWQYPHPVVRGGPGTMWHVWNDENEAHAGRPFWGQDRAKMKAGHFTGIDNLLAEDMAVAEMMGPIVDRSRENLGSSDTAVARFRRQYLAAIRDNEQGVPPRATSTDVPFRLIEGRGIYHAEAGGWRGTLDPELA